MQKKRKTLLRPFLSSPTCQQRSLHMRWSPRPCTSAQPTFTARLSTLATLAPNGNNPILITNLSYLPISPIEGALHEIPPSINRTPCSSRHPSPQADRASLPHAQHRIIPAYVRTHVTTSCSALDFHDKHTTNEQTATETPTANERSNERTNERRTNEGARL